MRTLETYLPQDRLRALARGESLPDHVTGAALFADISGFTPLTETLTQQLGPRRGIEELTRQINAVYEALISAIEKYGGSVISFAGDAITCWFDGDTGYHAVAAALAIQTTMAAFPHLGLKVVVTSGPARRFAVGDPAIQLLDALAGATIARVATAEHLATRGEILLDAVTATALGEAVAIRAWRLAENGERFAVLQDFRLPILDFGLADLPPGIENPKPEIQNLKSWILPPVWDHEQSGHGAFLTELRPAVALFLRFIGLNYDADERAGKKLDALIRAAQAILTRHEGILLQLTIGDKGSYLYGVFGAPIAHEDDARRAVQAALELRKGTAALTFLAPVQIGISQGTMRAGAYGGSTRRTYGVLGDEVNLAARLMTAAAPGELLVSSRVQKTVADWFNFEPRPPLPMKGKAELLPVFAATSVRQQRAVRLQEPTYALPMVGRQSELQCINDKLDLTLAGKAQIIGIVGEAGLGKSRLVAEVIRSARKKGFAGYGGACQSDAIHTPYHPWKSIGAAFFSVDAELPVRKQIRLLESEIEDRAPERVQAMPLLRFLLNLDIPDNDFTRHLEPQFRQSALHALLGDCLRAAANEEPQLIVIEDFHWVDALSHDLLEELARALPDSPVCFVLAYRPPQPARAAAHRLERLPNFTNIELCELTQAESEQAIRAKLAQLYPARTGVVLPALVEKLLARAQGNPFYLEELLNFLRDRGLDPLDPDDLTRIELPDSLHTLILSRIDQLSEGEKTTLRVASIIGRFFRVAWLTGYYPDLGALTRVQADLEKLAEMDITPLDATEPELAYLFKHIVTHEVTYETLPFATRTRLHERLAQYLERQIETGALRETALLDTLVYHYSRSDNHDKHRAYLQKAGQAALAVSAFNTAVNYFTRLLELTPESDPDRTALALQLAEAHYRFGNFPAARAAITEAQAAAQTDADRAAALALLGEMMSQWGHYAEAQAILAEAVQLARTADARLTLCRALYALGATDCALGKLDIARISLNESLDLACELGDLNRELFALNRLGTMLIHHDIREAEQILREVYVRAAAAGNRERATAALNNLGVVADESQDLEMAREYFQKALALAREIGAQQMVALYLSNLASIDIKRGELDAARAGLREGLALALRLGAFPRLVNAVMYFANLAWAEGHTERALVLLGLARRHPVWSSSHQRELDAALARWALEPEVVEAGLTQGAQLDWDMTLQELLKD